MSSRNSIRNPANARLSQCVHAIENISVHYEGQTEELALRSPDVSSRGMFICTARSFPEGAVLKISFRLALSGAEISTRCEVRYCLPGVGVGVEFVGISPEAVRDIEREVKLCNRRLPRRKTAKKK